MNKSIIQILNPCPHLYDLYVALFDCEFSDGKLEVKTEIMWAEEFYLSQKYLDRKGEIEVGDPMFGLFFDSKYPLMFAHKL